MANPSIDKSSIANAIHQPNQLVEDLRSGTIFLYLPNDLMERMNRACSTSNFPYFLLYNSTTAKSKPLLIGKVVGNNIEPALQVMSNPLILFSFDTSGLDCFH